MVRKNIENRFVFLNIRFVEKFVILWYVLVIVLYVCIVVKILFLFCYGKVFRILLIFEKCIYILVLRNFNWNYKV